MKRGPWLWVRFSALCRTLSPRNSGSIGTGCGSCSHHWRTEQFTPGPSSLLLFPFCVGNYAPLVLLPLFCSPWIENSGGEMITEKNVRHFWVCDQLALNNWAVAVEKFLVKQQFESIINSFRHRNPMRRQWIKPKKSTRGVTHPLLFSQNTSFGKITGFGKPGSGGFESVKGTHEKSLKFSHNECF